MSFINLFTLEATACLGLWIQPSQVIVGQSTKYAFYSLPINLVKNQVRKELNASIHKSEISGSSHAGR